MMRKALLKIVFVQIFLFFALFVVNSQEYDDEEYYTEEQEEKSKLDNRFFFGGNLGLAFGTTTYIEISPLVGYYINEKLSAAVGPIYQYYKYRPYDISMNIIGGRVYSRYLVFRSVFIHVEEGLLFVKSDLYNMQGNENNDDYKPVNQLLVGGGFKQQLGERSAVNLVILWNLTESEYYLIVIQ